VANESPAEMAMLQRLAHDYLQRPTLTKRRQLERRMSNYVRYNLSADIKALMKLRLQLYNSTKNWDKQLQF